AGAHYCVAVLFSVLPGGCSRAPATEAAAPDIPTVAVAKVASETLSREMALTAEFKPYQEIDVMAKITGYIKEIRVDAGDRVEQGQVLGVLESPGLEGDLRRANARDELSNAEVA